MYLRATATVSSILLVCCTLAQAGEAATQPPAEELSPAARRALAAAEESIAKARSAYQTAAAKEQERLVAALAREQEAQTKAGKLEAALAVKAMVEQVKSGEFLRQLEERAASTDDLLGDRAAPGAPQLSRLAGHWHMGFNNDWRRLVRIQADGRVDVLRSNNVREGSSYTIRWDARSQRFVSEGLGGMVETYRVDGDRLACEHWCDGSAYPAQACSLTAVVERVPAPPAGGERERVAGPQGGMAPRR